MVARMVRDHEAASSSLATPTIVGTDFTLFRRFLCLRQKNRHPLRCICSSFRIEPACAELRFGLFFRNPVIALGQKPGPKCRKGISGRFASSAPRQSTADACFTLKPTQSIVGAGFHARPALEEGKRRFARPNGARAVPAGSNTCGGGRYRAHRGKRRRNRPRRMGATTPPRQSRSRGASRTPPLTGGS